MYQISHMLRWFSRDTDELAGEEPLRGVTVEKLRRLFPNDDDPQRYLSYELTADQLDAVQRYVEHRIDLSRYAYVVEADAVTSAKPRLSAT